MEIEELIEKIKTVIDMEQRGASMAPITPLYVSRMLNVPLEAIEACIGLTECQSGRSEVSANS